VFGVSYRQLKFPKTRLQISNGGAINEFQYMQDGGSDPSRPYCSKDTGMLAENRSPPHPES